MSKNELFGRKPLGNIISYPEHIISVYVVEYHIWAGSKNQDEARKARRNRQGEINTVEEYLIDPVRSLLTDIFRHISAPYDPSKRDNPAGQGYWIQAEFGSGKSHLLSFIGSLALGQKELWNRVEQKEIKSGKGKRESLYQFYDGIARKSTGDGKGIFVVAKTFVGQGGGDGGTLDRGRTLVKYIIEAVKEQYLAETGETIALYPTELLARWFINHDLNLLRKDFEKFLKDPKEFDEEARWSLDEFLEKLQNPDNPDALMECGKKLWDYYEKRRGGVPQNIIPEDPEPLLKHMIETIMSKGYRGVLFIFDEMSLFMKNRNETQRAADEQTLVVLANRLVHYHNLPVWTICAAQQLIEAQMGQKNIIANERLKLVPLLNNEEDYHDIVLSRIRTINNKEFIEAYWEDYSRGFTWPSLCGKSKFEKFFPFHIEAIDIMKNMSYQLTTIRAGLDILHQTLKTQIKKKSSELVTMWSMFDDMVLYEEDPSGTTKGTASLKTRWNEEWKSYETAKKRINSGTHKYLQVYNNRCLKILKTLFLYHVAKVAMDGLTSEQLMNCVMEWKDHDKGQGADSRDNLDHYEMLIQALELEVAQISKLNNKYIFRHLGGGLDPHEVFAKVRNKSEEDIISQKHAWEHLLSLREWTINTGMVTVELSHITSIFKNIAPSMQENIIIKWHGREIQGKLFMKDIRSISAGSTLPSLYTYDSAIDFHVFISSTPCFKDMGKRIKQTNDPRVIIWSPEELLPAEKDLLIDFVAYRKIIEEYQGKDTDEAMEMITWVQNKLKVSLGAIYRIVPDSYGRGRMSALEHSNLNFTCQGELINILTPVVSLVMDSVYKSKEIEFTASASFNDNEAIKVINGIVKVGEIDKNAKKDKDYSAAQNFGYSLGIMKKSNDKKLDTGGNDFIEAIRSWIDDKFTSSGSIYIPAEAIYKNFTGINGPNGINYGLSVRMIQLYLLCLVKEGKIKLTLKGKGGVLEYIDSSNIAGVDFKAYILDNIDRIYQVKSPEGWAALAPFAALMLKDTDIISVKQDGEINSAVDKVIEYKNSNITIIKLLSNGLNEFFSYIKMESPLRDSLASWIKFLEAKVESHDKISFLRDALEKAFGYRVYSSDSITKEDLDDFKCKLNEIEHAQNFSVHMGKIKTIYDYSTLTIPKGKEVSILKKNMSSLCNVFEKINNYIDNESALHMELLEPGEKIINSYISIFLQAYDGVVKATGQAKDKIGLILKSKNFKTLEILYSVEQLSGNTGSVKSEIELLIKDLFSCRLSKHDIEEKLTYGPYIKECILTLENAYEFIERADKAVNEAEKILREKLEEKAGLLLSGALRKRLEQGSHEEIIKDILSCKDKKNLADFLSEKLGNNPELIEIIKKYLKRIVIKKLKISEFRPSRKTIEPQDVDEVVREFRVFIEKALKVETREDLPVVEFE